MEQSSKEIGEKNRQTSTSPQRNLGEFFKPQLAKQQASDQIAMRSSAEQLKNTTSGKVRRKFFSNGEVDFHQLFHLVVIVDQGMVEGFCGIREEI
jgi:hypothetical protein